MSQITPQVLYKTSALLYGLTVPGHVIMGYQIVYNALNTIPSTKFEDRAGKQGARNCWDYLTAALAASALLNWQWAKTSGPQTTEEIAILVITNVTTFINGMRYLSVGEYKAGLGIVAPSSVSLAAYILQNL